jgi:phosphatidate cytidylyltransferase
MPTLSLDPRILLSFTVLYGLLIGATSIVWRMQAKHQERDFSELSARVQTWWYITTAFAFALLTTEAISLVFFALISFLALREYLTLIPTRSSDSRVLNWIYLAIPLQYYWVWLEWYGMFIIFIPVYLFLFLPLRLVLIGETKGFIGAAATMHWGAMITIFSLSHLSYLLVLRHPEHAPQGGASLVLYVVVLTQLNDVAQYIWGKKTGRHKIVPSVSPNKTWEGFLGGVLTTTILAVLISPFLTPMSLKHALLAGLIISVAGFIGDVTISALKRDLGIKDSGTLLPGHGGVLDRVDSLTYTAPLFFHYVYFLYF